MTRFSMQYGTQTRKSSSGQPFDEEYQIWLAGYWEDFTSSYSLPEAESNKLSSTGTHFGNPMNCEARLNPHYRWSYPDRIATYSGSVIYQGKVTKDINLLHNLSMSEWLSIDPIRLGKGRNFVSKINNEYLDSHAHSNRYRFGGKGELDNYISMTPSYASGGKYLINNGDIDVSYGRSGAVKYGFDDNAGQPLTRGSYFASAMGEQESYVDIDVSTQFNETGEDIRIYHTASAVTCGVFSTDTSPSDIFTISSWNADQSPVEILGAEIKSPSRTPFLAVRHSMPATNRLEGKLTADGEWEYTGAKRQLFGLRVGDTVQVGKDDHFCVIQEINTSTNKITKLYSLSNNALIDRDKYVFPNSTASYLGGGADPDNVDIRKLFEPVITYDGDLNCIDDGDTFHLRFCPLAINNKGLPDTDRVAHYILRVGFDSSRLNITSNGNRATIPLTDYQPSFSCAAIEVELQLHPISEAIKIQKDINQVRISALDSSIATDHQQAFIDYDNSGTVTAPNYTNEWEHWVDVDVVMDFTNQRYKVYIDGYEAGTFNFETKPSGGAWVASDLYGWHMDHAALQKDGTYIADTSSNQHSMSAGKYWGPEARRTSTLYTLIDRVGIVNELTNPVRSSPNSITNEGDLLISSVSYDSIINRVSSMKVKIIDDGNERQIQDIFTSTPSEWMLLFFKNGIDSTYWTGFLDEVQVIQDKLTKGKEITVVARDSLGRMDGLMPYWEVGQNESGPHTTEYIYRREEAQMVTDNFYLGARALLRGQESIGMDHQTRAAHPQASTTEIGAIQGYYAARYDQRTRLYSSNPIQMYVGGGTYSSREKQTARMGLTFGPSVDMDVYNTSPTAQDSNKNIWRMWNTRKIIGFSDGRFHGEKTIIAHCIEHKLKVGDEFKIYGANVPNAFTVQSGGTVDGLDIVVKKILDDNHFCFEYKSSVGSIFGRSGDEPGHFVSVITRDATNKGLGLSLSTTNTASNPYTLADQYYKDDKAEGLAAILAPNKTTSAMGRMNVYDGRQWSSYYENNTGTDIDHNGLGLYDSIINNAMCREISTTFDRNTVESHTDFAGFGSYNFKPAGIVPMQGTGLSNIYDEHALITVGPRAHFLKGITLNNTYDGYNHAHALEYLNHATETDRSQILTIVDAYRRFRKFYDATPNSGYIVTDEAGYTVIGTDDDNMTLLIRGNDIDQQEPKNLPTATGNDNNPTIPPSTSVTENLTSSANPREYDGRAAYFMKNTEIQVLSESAGGSWYSSSKWIELPSGSMTQFPYSGYATVGPDGNTQSIIKWLSMDSDTDRLEDLSRICIGSGGVQGGGGDIIRPLTFPVICHCQAIFTPPVARQPRQQYRVAHASYMHDIASSMWFRMVFGIIEMHEGGTHGPPYWAAARQANSLFAGWTSPLLAWFGTGDGEWDYKSLAGGSPELYGDDSQFTDTFTLTENYDPALDTSFTIAGGTPPLIDGNFKDRRWIDKGSRTIDNGTDPTISIPSRAWTPSANQFINSGGLVFEIDNTDGTLDVGAARSCRMTTCTDDTDEQYTHWEIVRVKQGEIRNIIDPNNEWVLPSESQGKAMPGPIWLTAAHDPTDYNSTAKYLYDTTNEKDPDFFHSGDPKAVSGSRMFASLKVGDIVFVGNTQGTKAQDVTNVINEEFNVDNPYGEERDFVSYRWYRVIEKKDGGNNTSLHEETNSAIAIFPAEYAYCDHEYLIGNSTYPHKHPVGMAETLEETIVGPSGFVGWHHKLVRGSASNPNQAQLPSGFPTVNASITKVYSGHIQVSGVKHLTETHKAGTKGRFRYIRNNFNHIWLNWADMRNDGSADADGGTRKTEFGLIYPSEDSYKVDIIFSATQSDISSLKIGEDVDLWELTDVDPFTSAAWSQNYTNTQTGYDHLHDWESKAGAPMAVDTSKFFNLNTMANNGKVGQSSGGTKILADYEFGVSGEVILMDNYWWQAGPHPYTAKYRHPYDPNWQFYVRYETKLAQNTMGNKPVFLIDSSNVYQGLHFTDWVNAGIIESKPESSPDGAETFTYKMGGCFITDYDETLTSHATRLYLDFGAEKLQGGSIATTMNATEFYNNNIGTLDKNRDHNVFNNWSSIMSLGAMLSIEGHVRSRGSNTYYEHDKIRLLWQTHTVQSWLSGSDLPCSYDINNVPISINMDYGQQGGSSSIDSFGSVMDGRGKTTLSIINEVKLASGNGDGGTYTAFNYLIGRDNRFEFRPSYGSGLTLDRNNLAISDIETEARAQFTHVRAFYNNGESFVDMPTPILDGSQTKWKILSIPQVRTSTEAQARASKELERIKNKAVEVTAKVIGDGTNTNSMFDGGLYGYISTPLIQCCSAITGIGNYGPFFPTGSLTGTIIGGRVNAMDGNLDATNSNYIGAQRSMEYLESGRGYHGGGGCDTYDTHATDWYGQFTPYGISSIEKAIQIVHIPKGVPKVSDATGHKLRMFITHASNVANEGKFRIWLIDTVFDSQRRQGLYGDDALTSTGISYLDVEGNGFFEIAFPSSYGAGSQKMIVSFNREYCIDLLRYRSNNSNSSKSNRGNRITTLPSTSVSILDLSHGNLVNEASAFPLGLSLYYRPYGSEDSQGRQGPLWQLRPRSLYYAPQIEIVDDFVWRVGRTVTYIDSKLNLNENLTLMAVKWDQKRQNKEKTTLKLQKDESQATQRLGLGVGTAPISAPATSPPTNDGGSSSGGGIGGLPWLPGDNWDGDGAPGWGGLKPPQRGGIGSQHTIDTILSIKSRQHSISGAPDQQGGSGMGATMSGSKIGINRMSRGATNAIKGTGDLLSEGGEGETGLLGINRNRSSKQTSKVTSKEAMGQTKHTGSGSAMLSEEGFTLPGVSKIPEGGSVSQADYHESSVIITVPQAVSSNRVSVIANVIAPSTGGGSKYTLFCALECIETGFKQSRAIDITANDSAQRIVLFSTRNVNGANTSGNRIRIIIGRVPGGGSMTDPDGADDSPMASLTVKGIEIMFNESAQNQSTGKKSMTSKLTTNDNTKGWMTETSNAWQSKTSDADYDTAGNITYSRRGKRGSNVLRKKDGAGGHSEDEL